MRDAGQQAIETLRNLVSLQHPPMELRLKAQDAVELLATALSQLQEVQQELGWWAKVAAIARAHNALDSVRGFAARDERKSLKARLVTAACDAERFTRDAAAARVQLPEGGDGG